MRASRLPIGKTNKETTTTTTTTIITITNYNIKSAYQEMVYCPVSNSSSQKPFVVHGTEGFEPRRADDECDYRKIVGVVNMCVFYK